VRKVIEYLLRNDVDGIVPRTLAWCLGQVDDEVYYREVEKYVKDTNRAKKTKKSGQDTASESD
jgi:hypothetical protein